PRNYAATIMAVNGSDTKGTNGTDQGDSTADLTPAGHPGVSGAGNSGGQAAIFSGGAASGSTQTQQGPAIAPKTAQAISLILQSMGVEDAEPRVIHQLLDFTFRTTIDFVEHASLLAEHAGRQELAVDDVQLAIQQIIQ